ncbi:MAG TPA: BamA/TamA family outer membrane protein [Gemmatimonadaceae bacterium]
MPRHPLGLFGLGVIGAVLAATAPLRAQGAGGGRDERESPEVEALSLTGVHHVDASELRHSIATQANACKSILLAPFCWFSDSKLFVAKHYLDRTELKRDVLRIKVFYWRRGYRDTAVDTAVTRKGDGVRVRFAITEGAPTLVSSVTVVRPESLLTRKALRKAMLLHAGKPLDLIALDSSLVLLRNVLWDDGYSDAVLRDTIILARGDRSAAVRVTVDPRWQAHIDTVIVRGNEGVSLETIHNMITLRAGEIYRRRDIVESQRNLYASNLFRRAVITIPPPGDSTKRIAIGVEESPFRDVRLSGGFNTVDFGQLEARYTDYNWLGGARRLAITGVVSNLLAPSLNGTGIFQNVTGNLNDVEAAPYLRPNFQSSIDLTQPWFHDPRNTLGFSIFAHRQSAPAIFIDRGYGAAASFTRDVAPRSPLSLVYRYELTEVDAGGIYFCVNYGVCERPTINALRGRHALSPVSLDLFTDRSDDPLDPTTGYQARLDLEHASAFTGSDFRYNRISGDASRYMPFWHGVLAGHVRFGWVKSLRSTGNALGTPGDTSGDILHPRKRFYAGGSQSVRGYGENQLGPRVLTVDPQILIDSGCTMATIADRSCDPSRVPSSAFEPRPTGGTSVIEASIEYRFPIWKQLFGAVFVDGAFVGEGALRDVTKGTGAITPGFGVRYKSPVGPIRVDLGIKPTLVERLHVVTELVNPDSTRSIVELTKTKNFDPLEDTGSGLRKILSRLTLHLSIGQAF